MTEYIITEKQLKTATEAHTEREIPLPFTEVFVSGDKLPEIVRCRDCRWCMAYSKATYCDRFAHGLPTVEPDGFCAWGERRDA